MRWRHLPLYLGLLIFSGLLLWRLFDLTIVRGAYFRSLSEGNRVLEKSIPAPRGIIYDRNGQVLARNIPIDKLEVGSEKWELVTRDEALDIEAKGGTGAAKLEMDLGRDYPEGSVSAHLLGYMGEAGKDEVGSGKWEMGDMIGRTGIEQQYEEILRGKDGKELIEVDATGKKIADLGKIDPKPGQDLHLSIDLGLQKVAAKEMAGVTGAVIVSNPQTGEILALVSTPSFDPNKLEQSMFTDSGRPMFDRAISGLYPPGSTFIIFMATAGLETGAINAQTEIEDNGAINIGPYSFPNWYFLQYGGKEGNVNIVKALQRSNDIFFYKVGEMVGIDKLETWMKKFGLGKPLGIDLPGEVGGLVPTPAWRKSTYGTDWFLGDTYHLSIGQGDMEVTPLQVNTWTNVIANGGKLCKPEIKKLGNEEIKGNCREIGIKKETVNLITEGMQKACETGGTGWPLFNFQVTKETNGTKVTKAIETACKTGTAEYGDPKNNTHAWFTIFAPVDNPQISVTVLVEGGGEGSNVAAPIAKKILEEWFGR